MISMQHIIRALKHPVMPLAAVFGGLELWAFLKGPAYSWDGSVYAGMGKWLYSGGSAGLWEVFRPVLWPIVEGAFWSAGLDPLWWGGLLAIAAAIACLFLVHSLGERIRPGAGLLAALVLAATPLFAKHAGIPMTDVSSTLFAVLSLLLLLRKRFFLAGLSVGAAFMLRFSQGLALPVLGALILLFHLREYGFRRLLLLAKRGALALLGFAVLSVPFFIYNRFAYGNALLPLQAGNDIIKGAPWLYHKGFWFYPLELARNNPLLLLAVPALAIFVAKFQVWKKNRALVAVTASFLAYAAYFTWQPHKELRYALPFVPHLAILSGFALSWLRVSARTVFWAGTVALAIAGGLFVARVDLSPGAGYEGFYRFFEGKEGAYLGASPVPAAFSDVRLVAPLYDSWQNAHDLYVLHREEAEYVALDSCVFEQACAVDASCKQGKEELLSLLEEEGIREYEATVGDCELSIYRLK